MESEIFYVILKFQALFVTSSDFLRKENSDKLKLIESWLIRLRSLSCAVQFIMFHIFTCISWPTCKYITELTCN